MVSTSLSQAVAAFANALNGLRQKYVEDFAASLREPFNRRKLSSEGINAKIAALRNQFAAEFVNAASVPVIRALSPGSERSIVEQLNGVQIELQSLASAAPAAAVARDGGISEILRAMVGAGLGAVTALILVAMQIHQPLAGPVRLPAGSVTHPGGSGTRSDGAHGGAAPAAEVKSPAPTATPPNASASDGAPPAPPSPPPLASAAGRVTPEQGHFLRSVLIWIIGGTLGAVFGAFVVCFPPLPLFDRFAGRSRTIAIGSRRKGADLGRAGVAVLGAVGVAIATGAVASIGRMVSDPKPVWTGFGSVCALSLLLVARFLALPKRASAGPTDAIEALQRDLIAESNFWSVLSGGLVSQKTDFRTVALLKGIIVEHRGRNERSEDILQLVEQELGLPMGGQPPEASEFAFSDFVWAAEHEKLYDTFGIVEVGDRVKVKVPPRTVTSPSGVTTVVQRGLVSRQREH